jgi:hypothetical protein
LIQSTTPLVEVKHETHYSGNNLLFAHQAQ